MTSKGSNVCGYAFSIILGVRCEEFWLEFVNKVDHDVQQGCTAPLSGRESLGLQDWLVENGSFSSDIGVKFCVRNSMDWREQTRRSICPDQFMRQEIFVALLFGGFEESWCFRV